MEDFSGKICFVTGGANGIGQAIAKAFYTAKATVIFCDRDKEAGETMCREMEGIKFYQVDVTEYTKFKNLLEDIYKQYGSPDIIINNVGDSSFSPLTESGIEDFDRIIRTNLYPVFITSREMAVKRNTTEGKKQYGRIINIASTRYLQSESGTEAYSASKGGIVSLTHALAISLSGYNITVNCISPGWIETGDYEKIKPEDHQQHPSGRVGKPGDIARMCLFLAHPENDFINGQNIIIDGGMTRKMIYAE